jgi:hypothetical protein
MIFFIEILPLLILYSESKNTHSTHNTRTFILKEEGMNSSLAIKIVYYSDKGILLCSPSEIKNNLRVFISLTCCDRPFFDDEGIARVAKYGI